MKRLIPRRQILWNQGPERGSFIHVVCFSFPCPSFSFFFFWAGFSIKEMKKFALMALLYNWLGQFYSNNLVKLFKIGVNSIKKKEEKKGKNFSMEISYASLKGMNPVSLKIG